MNFIGLDVGKLYCQLCEISDTGEIWETRLRIDRDRLTAIFRGRPHARVLLESGTSSGWIARVLEQLGHEVVVADPNYAPMYASRSRRIKTDRRDAHALAEACRLGAYRPSHRTKTRADTFAH